MVVSECLAHVGEDNDDQGRDEDCQDVPNAMSGRPKTRITASLGCFDCIGHIR